MFTANSERWLSFPLNYLSLNVDLKTTPKTRTSLDVIKLENTYIIIKLTPTKDVRGSS